MSSTIRNHETAAIKNAQQDLLSPENPELDIRRRLKSLKPWRMSVQITPHTSTFDYLSLEGTTDNECHRSRANTRSNFLRQLDLIFPDGMSEKRFLDCGCNAGGYCFWARERDASFCLGFDIREHWIRQAKFIRNKRTVHSSNRIQLKVLNLYELPQENVESFDYVNFRGLFYHLHEPVAGLRIAADMSKDILVFSSAILWGKPDGSLYFEKCEKELLHGGVEPYSWFPSGPEICGELIRNLGFEELKLTKNKQVKARPDRGRIEIVAAREKGRLKNLNGSTI